MMEMLWTSEDYSWTLNTVQTILLQTYTCTPSKAQWILNNFLQQDTCCWLWHSCEGSFVVINPSLAEWIETTTPSWWVTTQICKLLHKKWKVTTTGRSAIITWWGSLQTKNSADSCEDNIMQSKNSIVKSLLRATVQAYKSKRTL